MSQQLKQIFSQEKLGTRIAGFQLRVAQQEMAQAIASCILHHRQLVVEAPTGTGKTFAYLVPALMAKKKTIISTGSKTLQDQLFNRDLPTMVKALNFTGKTALLKGRANYLCLERLDKVIAEGVIGDKTVWATLKKIRFWQAQTQTGDFAECHNLAEDDPILPQLVSRADNCLGSHCPHYQACYVMKARQKAMQADLVVVNHHLFFADMAVKEGGFGELIPNAEVIIFDEAHQIPDVASQYFSDSLTSRQLFDFCRDLSIVYRVELKDMKQLDAIAQRIQKAGQDFRLCFSNEHRRGNWREMATDSTLQQALDLLIRKLEQGEAMIKVACRRSQTLQNLWERLQEFLGFLARWKVSQQTGYCYWYETFGRHFNLNITPLSVADRFATQIAKQNSAWIFTSATLEVAGSVDYFCQRLGLEQAEIKCLASPFDYPNQALLCVPRYLPLPNRPDTLTQLAKMLLPVIEANDGRCFVLCTSYLMMQGFAEYFREHSSLNVLLQGEKPKAQLLDTFLLTPRSVLVASQSFWEGVDVRGNTLSLVIIDKLPFTAPDEPLFQARLEDCRLQGGNPFEDIQIPDAVIGLKQGVGRLIRDKCDKGVVIICDNRLVMKAYAQRFLQSLPKAGRTRSLHNVIQFLTAIHQNDKPNEN